MTPFIPLSSQELAAYVAQASQSGTPLAIMGGNTRGVVHHPDAQPVSTSGLSGITLYEPAEMVIGASAGTPLRTLKAELAKHGQMLPFEPMDHSALIGAHGDATVGALAAANISGPRRVSIGAARDHLIGIEMVNGRGEIIRSGGRVMKNVTGLDLVKLNAGAFGSFGVLTEVFFKLLPARETSMTLCWHDLAPTAAIALMTTAMGTPFDVDAAAFQPNGPEGSQTVLRIEGFAPSCAYRAGRLSKAFAEYGAPEIIEGADSLKLWAEIRDAKPLADPQYQTVLRVHIASSRAPALIEKAGAAGIGCMIDWAGGLVWLGLTGEHSPVQWQAQIAKAGGHASIVRSSFAGLDRIAKPDPRIAQLIAGIRQSFDPKGIFNPGTLYSG